MVLLLLLSVRHRGGSNGALHSAGGTGAQRLQRRLVLRGDGHHAPSRAAHTTRRERGGHWTAGTGVYAALQQEGGATGPTQARAEQVQHENRGGDGGEELPDGDAKVEVQQRPQVKRRQGSGNRGGSVVREHRFGHTRKVSGHHMTMHTPQRSLSEAQKHLAIGVRAHKLMLPIVPEEAARGKVQSPQCAHSSVVKYSRGEVYVFQSARQTRVAFCLAAALGRHRPAPNSIAPGLSVLVRHHSWQVAPLVGAHRAGLFGLPRDLLRRRGLLPSGQQPSTMSDYDSDSIAYSDNGFDDMDQVRAVATARSSHSRAATQHHRVVQRETTTTTTRAFRDDGAGDDAYSTYSTSHATQSHQNQRRQRVVVSRESDDTVYSEISHPTRQHVRPPSARSVSGVSLVPSVDVTFTSTQDLLAVAQRNQPQMPPLAVCESVWEGVGKFLNDKLSSRKVRSDGLTSSPPPLAHIHVHTMHIHP